MKAKSVYSFHTVRRAFIMMPDGNLLLAPEKSDLSHEQMLCHIGMNQGDIPNFMTTVPRGYYMDNDVCVYQGLDMTPGTIWRVAPTNYHVIKSFVPKLRQAFQVTDETNLYLGVRVGAVGTVWEKLYKTTIGEFMR